MAAITSLIITMIFGKSIIRILQKKQIGEEIRELGLEGQIQKKGTPTMGGLIIIGGIVVPTLLFADILNVYVIIMLITTIWLGFIGFLDDYIKVFKKDKKGLEGKFKIAGQIILGLIVGDTLAKQRCSGTNENNQDSSRNSIFYIKKQLKNQQTESCRVQGCEINKNYHPFLEKS
jgi:UDP-N-acetylmuramyl pentapeptide phosphotransferase/UDP-N-acetylglucosamine-1-phosphate transferase